MAPGSRGLSSLQSQQQHDHADAHAIAKKKPMMPAEVRRTINFDRAVLRHQRFATTMPTDKTEAGSAPSAPSNPPDPRAEAPKIHGETGKPSALLKKWPSSPTRLPSIIVGVVVAAVGALSIWYLLRPQPLLVQGEVDATRFDIAARVDGRVAEIPVERGQDIAAGAVLVKIDNPETLAKNEQTLAAKIVASSEEGRGGEKSRVWGVRDPEE